MVGAFVSFYAVTRFQLHVWPAVVFPQFPGRSGRRDRVPDGHPPLHGGLHGAGHHHRARGLQAAARRPADRRPHHRHRRVVLPGVFWSVELRLFAPVHPLPAPLRSRGLVHQRRRPSGERDAGATRWQHHVLQHLPHHRRWLGPGAGLSAVPRPAHQDRHGHAGDLLRQADRPADGDQRGPGDLLHLRHRGRLSRGWAASCTPSPTPPSGRSWASCRA